MRRLLALVVALVALAPSAAEGAPILSDEDAAELANSLADAREEHDVCYGWYVSVNDQGSGPSGDDIGSDRGPSTPVDPSACRHYAVLTGAILYTSQSSESEDSARIGIETSFPAQIAAADLERLGYDDDELLGDEDDVALMNMVGALPGLVAEREGLRAVPFETPEVPAEQQGEPTDSPGSDFLRENVIELALGGVLLALGLIWFVLYRMGLLQPGLRAVKRALD